MNRRLLIVRLQAPSDCEGVANVLLRNGNSAVAGEAQNNRCNTVPDLIMRGLPSATGLM
jgi:hypothetical protein